MATRRADRGRPNSASAGSTTATWPTLCPSTGLSAALASRTATLCSWLLARAIIHFLELCCRTSCTTLMRLPSSCSHPRSGPPARAPLRSAQKAWRATRGILSRRRCMRMWGVPSTSMVRSHCMFQKAADISTPLPSASAAAFACVTREENLPWRARVTVCVGHARRQGHRD